MKLASSQIPLRTVASRRVLDAMCRYGFGHVYRGIENWSAQALVRLSIGGLWGYDNEPLPPFLERLFLATPQQALTYYSLFWPYGDRWPAGENALSQDIECAYTYQQRVLCHVPALDRTFALDMLTHDATTQLSRGWLHYTQEISGTKDDAPKVESPDYDPTDWTTGSLYLTGKQWALNVLNQTPKTSAFDGHIDPGAGAVPHEDEDELWHKREVSRTASVTLPRMRDLGAKVVSALRRYGMLSQPMLKALAGKAFLAIDGAGDQRWPEMEPFIFGLTGRYSNLPGFYLENVWGLVSQITVHPESFPSIPEAGWKWLRAEYGTCPECGGILPSEEYHAFMDEDSGKWFCSEECAENHATGSRLASTKTASTKLEGLKFAASGTAGSRLIFTLDRFGLMSNRIRQAILSSPYPAYLFALDVVRGRVPEAEPAIASVPDTAYFYSIDFIKERWPEAEPAILTSPRFSSLYAQFVLKKRWPKAEPIICQDEQWATDYARRVLGYRYPSKVEEWITSVRLKSKTASSTLSPAVADRWPIRRICRVLYRYGLGKQVTDAAEAVNAANATSAASYSRFMDQRFPKLEPVIVKDYAQAISYVEMVVKGRWPELEDEMLADPHSAPWISEYAARVIKGAWPEAEAKIARDPDAVYDYASKALQHQRFPAGEPTIARILMKPGDLFGRPQGYYSAWGYAQDVALQGRYNNAPTAEREKAAEEWARGVRSTSKTASSVVKVPSYRMYVIQKAILRYFPSSRVIEASLRAVLQGRDAARAYSFAANVLGRRWPEAEPLILMDSSAAVHYAMECIKGRWPALEAQILAQNNTGGAIAYCRYVLKGPWPEMQDTIVRSAHAYEYGLLVLKLGDPLRVAAWVKAERARINAGKTAHTFRPDQDVAVAKVASSKIDPDIPYRRRTVETLTRFGLTTKAIMNAIASSAKPAFNYAKFTIRGPWPEGESAIAKRADTAYYYTAEVTHKRFKQGEPAIFTGRGRFDAAHITYNYILKLRKDDPQSIDAELIDNVEEVVSRSPEFAFRYAWICLKSKWSGPHAAQAEASIKSDPDWQERYKSLPRAKKAAQKTASTQLSRWRSTNVYKALDRYGFMQGRLRDAVYHSPLVAADFAIAVNRRLPEIEPLIAAHPQAAMYYAIYLLKDPNWRSWPDRVLPERKKERDRKEDDELLKQLTSSVKTASTQLSSLKTWRHAAKMITTCQRYDLATKPMLSALETSCTRNSHRALYYAEKVLKHRWPRGEEVILATGDPSICYSYAKEVIQGRWPEAEKFIRMSSNTATSYALLVINKDHPEPPIRWPEAESFIAESPDNALQYVRYVLRHPWPEAEPTLCRQELVAEVYARDFLKLPLREAKTWGRDYRASHPETKTAKTASATLPRNITTWYSYQNDIFQALQRQHMWTKRLRAMFAGDADKAVLFARFVLQGRFPEGEPVIVQDPNVLFDYVQNVIQGRFPDGPLRETAERTLQEIPDFWHAYVLGQVALTPAGQIKFFGKTLPWQSALEQFTDTPAEAKGLISYYQSAMDKVGNNPEAVQNLMHREILPLIRDEIQARGYKFPDSL